MKPLNTAAIGKAFVTVLEGWLTRAELVEIARLNSTPEYSEPVCATGDFCDSNMAMLEAFQTIDPEFFPDPSSTEQCELWDSAWTIGRSEIARIYGRKGN